MSSVRIFRKKDELMSERAKKLLSDPDQAKLLMEYILYPEKRENMRFIFSKDGSNVKIITKKS